MNIVDNERFREAMDTLNHEQRQAVEQIYGPVMVIAGPGTGKTQILALRIGNILMKTDVDPRNILCLTYTEAGTVAMRRRLTSFIGAEAYNVNIHTFHGFCNKVISEHAELFSSHRDLQPVDDLERVDLFEKMIDSWPPEHVLRRLKGDLYGEMVPMQKLFDVMKKEGWSSDYVINAADNYIANLPTKEGFYYKRNNAKRGITAGDPHEKNIADETRKIERFKAAARAFDQFNGIMQSNARYDFADMILWVLAEIKQNESLRYTLQEQYQFILVDEYQDTNGAQNELLFLLCGDIESQPNAFVVGDDDQSIYRFQGANLSNILEFASRWGQDLATVVLKNNYRSTQLILDAADALIDHNKERLAASNINIEKKLTAAGPFAFSPTGVLVGEFESETEELLGVRSYIESLLRDGAAPNEIAILYRQHKNIAPLVKYFQVEEIPHVIKRQNDVLEDPFIEKLIHILQFVQAEINAPFEANDALFSILHFPWFDIPAIDIATLAVHLRKERNGNWRKFICDTSILETANVTNTQSMLNASAVIESWIKTGINETIQTLFERLLYARPVFNYLKASGDVYNKLKLCNSFFNFIKSQAEKHEKLDLTLFLDIIERMRSNRLAIPYTQIEKSGDGIQLLTAHGSKGLEFDYVIVLGANSSKWEKAAAPRNSFKYPDTLVSSNEENKEEDERRLFYVALTRAKKQALVTYSRTLLNGKSDAPSRYVVEMQKSEVTDDYYFETNTASKESFLLSQFTPAPQLNVTYPPQIDDVLESLVLNISAVNKYLNCPITFYFENILRAPLAKSGPAGYGNAIHYALEQVFKSDENKLGSFPTLENLLYHFEQGMKLFASNFTQKAYASYYENGLIKLPTYYAHHIEYWKSIPTSKLEHQVRDVHVMGVPVTGIYDRADFINDQLQVVDYKTGSPNTGRGKMKQPDSNPELLLALSNEIDPEKRHALRKKINGGDYWRQLVFYKLLAQVDLSITKPFHSTYVSFVEADDNPKLYKHELHITPDDEQIVKQQLHETYQKIKNKEFSPGCGRSTCRWCSLLKKDE